jgi:hypothetical protein
MCATVNGFELHVNNPSATSAVIHCHDMLPPFAHSLVALKI